MYLLTLDHLEKVVGSSEERIARTLHLPMSCHFGTLSAHYTNTHYSIDHKLCTSPAPRKSKSRRNGHFTGIWDTVKGMLLNVNSSDNMASVATIWLRLSSLYNESIERQYGLDPVHSTMSLSTENIHHTHRHWMGATTSVRKLFKAIPYVSKHASFCLKTVSL